jgi:hypothetical protein
MVDNSEIVPGDIILLKNQAAEIQNGIYTVDSIDTAKAILTKTTLPANGSVIFVKGGKENRSYYYIKTTNSSSNPVFTQTQTQKKVLGFNKSAPSLTTSVLSSA